MNRRVLVAVGVVVVLAAGVGGYLAFVRDDGGGSTTTTVAAGGVRPTGDLSIQGDATTECPLDRCKLAQVTCPDTQPTVAELAIAPAQGTPKGLMIFFSGGEGRGWWATPTKAGEMQTLRDLQAKGFEVIEVAWQDGWGTAAPNQPTGFTALACRPATVVKWAHDTEYAPMGVDPGVGECGFCISGNSGGGSEAAYSLTLYGLDSIVDAMILSSGPPHADIASGCDGKPGHEGLAYDPENVHLIDGAYGHLKDDGPCAKHDLTFLDQWRADGVATGGIDYDYPTTRVHFVLGGEDPTIAPAQAQFYIDRLQQAGSPMVTMETVPTMPHGVTQDPAGRDAVSNALLGLTGG